MTQRVIAFDTETLPIGPGSVAPPMVCVSMAFREGGEVVTMLTGNGDACVEDDLRDLLAPGHLIVGHNVAYDLGVIAATYPALEALIWRKLELREVDDTLIREMLLNLSTCGQLDDMRMADGTAIHISYGLADLVLKHVGVDISEGKDDEDSPRLQYNTLDGMPAAHYPERFRSYAIDDASYALQVYEAQEEAIESESGYASCSTSRFHATAAHALFCITQNGMATDPEEVDRVRAWLAEELSDERLAPLVDAGILTPADPGSPYGGQRKKAAALVREWGGEVEEVETTTEDGKARLDFRADWLAYRERLEAERVKFTDPQKAKVRVKDALRPRIEEVAKRVGYSLKTTDTGLVSTDGETIGDLAPFDAILGAYAHRESLQKIVSTDLPAMEWPRGSGEIAPVVHFPFKTLVRTTRTSSSQNKRYPSRNGQQVHPKVRGCFVPRPGFVLCSCDYSSLELVTTAEVTFNLFGESVHHEKVNAGFNMHGFLGAQLAYELEPGFAGWCDDLGVNGSERDDIYGAFMILKTEDVPFFKRWRSMAKPFGLGYPGGLGPFKMLGLAKNTYDVNIVQIAEDRAEEHPEEFDEPSRSTLYYAKELYDMEGGAFDWNPVLRGIQLAAFIREDVWHATYPEMRRYFKHVQDECVDVNNPDLGLDDDGDRDRRSRGLCYTTPMGMHRAACSFTACANGMAMQSPAAEGAKQAVVDVVRATRDPSLRSILYGCKVVDFVHDEILIELLDEGPESLHARAVEVQRLMETAMAVVIKNTKVTTEAALMERWSKAAEPVFDAEGRLTTWRPE